jgi:small subunit ribosomal protein S16
LPVITQRYACFTTLRFQLEHEIQNSTFTNSRSHTTEEALKESYSAPFFFKSEATVWLGLAPFLIQEATFSASTLAVVLRMTRRGAKKKPFYRIVAADSRSPRDGRFLEMLGTYDPLKSENNIKVDAEKVASWIKKGAKPSQTVASLLKKKGAE